MNLRIASIALLASLWACPLFAQVGPHDIALSTRPTTGNSGIQLVNYNTGIARTVTGITANSDGNYTIALDAENIPNIWSAAVASGIGDRLLDFFTLSGDAVTSQANHSTGGGLNFLHRVHMFQGDLYMIFDFNSNLYRWDSGSNSPVSVTSMTSPNDIAVVGNKLYVVANGGFELWEVDVLAAPVSKTKMVFSAPAGSTAPGIIQAVCAVGLQDFATQLALVDSLGKLYFFTPGAAGVNLTVPQQGVTGVVAVANHPNPSKGMVIATSTQVFEEANFTNPAGPAIYTSPTPITDMATDQGNIKFTGQGCIGSNGKAPVMTYPGAPVQGNSTFQVNLQDCPPGVKARMMLGLSNTQHNGIPLPLDLGFMGAPGCTLDLGIILQFDFFTDPFGELHLPLILPVDPINHGLVLYVQFAVFDAGANFSGLTTSNAMTMINR